MYTKRGQATIVIFLAIIILAIILLIFFFKSRVYIGAETPEDLARELDPIIRHVENCLYETTQDSAVLLAQQGGYIIPQENTYRLYQDQKISYLCYFIPRYKTCSNRYLRLSDIETQLEQDINQRLNTCLKVKSFEKAGYTITTGNRDLKIAVGTDDIIATLNYPVKLTKDNLKQEITIFRKAVPLPLGRLFSSAIDIINLEASFGIFEPLTYSIFKSKFTNKPYIIQRLQPYPDKLYILQLQNTPTEKEPFIFQFFIQGESR